MPPRNFTDEEEAEIGKIYLSGYSTREIGRVYPVAGKTSIIAALRRQGIEQRSPAERNRLYKIDAHSFDIIDTQEKAYWWGFIYADGNIHRRSLTVMLKASDKNHILKLREFLKSEHPVKIIKNNNPSGNPIKGAHYFATDRHLANRLRELGIIARRGKWKQALVHLPKELYRHWIRGYFDGDGSAHKPDATHGAALSFCGSSVLLKWIRKVFAEEVGTNPEMSVRKHKTASIHYLAYSGNVVAHLVTDWMYQDATVWMPRKKKRIDDWPLPMKDPYLRERDEKGRFS